VNTLQLYGNIVDVFKGRIAPQLLSRETAGVSDLLQFGLGVSSFQDDPANIGDAVFFNKRFFIRSTVEGQLKDNQNRKLKEDRAENYRTVYSLGITKHPLEMRDRSILMNPNCNGRLTLDELIAQMMGPPRKLGQPPHTCGFLGIIEYDDILSTSLSVAPIHGEDIIPLMKKYARDSHPRKGVSGMVMGFARNRAQAGDDPKTLELNRRLFFDNPKDNDKAFETNAPHWISHTHGIQLAEGKSLFEQFLPEPPSKIEDLFKNMSSDETLLASVLETNFVRNDWEDCGHIIPRSTLLRYFIITFPIDAICEGERGGFPSIART
jgi:hypothetical protein